jgi:hypothetical protein
VFSLSVHRPLPKKNCEFGEEKEVEKGKNASAGR